MVRLRLFSINCRQVALTGGACKDVIRLLVYQTLRSRWLTLAAILLLIGCVTWVTWGGGTTKFGEYKSWQMITQQKQAAKSVFVQNPQRNLLMYSAISSPCRRSTSGAGLLDIVITTLDSAPPRYLSCCALADDSNILFVTRAKKSTFHHASPLPIWRNVVEYWNPGYHNARQFVCTVPEDGHVFTHVSLTSAEAACPEDPRHYLGIVRAVEEPVGLAVCGKLPEDSWGSKLDHLIQWFELQRLLGVDKVVLYSQGSLRPDLAKLFQYYETLRFLELVPIQLPGHLSPPRNDSQDYTQAANQFSHSTVLSQLDCQKRMSGYAWVTMLALNEFIVPQVNLTLKQYLKHKMTTHQDTAGFSLATQLFITDWNPSHPRQQLSVARHTRATLPRHQATAHVHVPSRVLGVDARGVIRPLTPFKKYSLPYQEVLLHHYRASCPRKEHWNRCDPRDAILNDVMLRYSDLPRRVHQVKTETGVK